MRTRIGATLRIVVLVMVTLVDLFWLVAFFGALIFDPSDIDGIPDVVLFLVVQVILTGIWFLLYRGIRGGRRGVPSGGGTRRLIQRAVRPAPHGRHTLAGNPTGPRTGLSARQINSTSWLSRADRQDVDLPEDGTLARLAVAEQALGNALYELDLRRGSHPLTKERISALRVAGLEASSWLSAQADLATVLPRGTRPAATQIREGIRRYADLARQTENVLAGRTGVADLDRACESLARSRG